ncbi:MAG TPA: glycosyltransferase [Candidatus Melainabacteria bacterium]|nr:glycosyltransferase [Candidatus Melainabacteria bacterium]HIN67430.1 glycosyltransferase [Candidatus Obscuribacterales bacterium]
MEKLISVCLPVFNGEKFLPEAIESVLAQTYSNFELLISDDCSTDSSAAIIARYAEQDKRIRFWKNEKRLGLFHNYNQCIANCQGEYIKPFAQDDLWQPNMLIECARVLSAHPDVALVSTRRSIIGGDGKELSGEQLISPADLFPGQVVIPRTEVVARSLFPLENFIGEPCTVMFRSEHSSYGFSTDLRQLGDLEYWLRLLRNGDYVFINEPLASFRKHKDGASASNGLQLWHASDIIHMSYSVEGEIEDTGKTRYDFVQQNMRNFAIHVDYLVDTFGASERGLHEKAVMRKQDFEGVKEALFHSLLLNAKFSRYGVGPDGEFSLAKDRFEVLKKELAIKRSEAVLQKLLSSFSWTSTRMFRELRRAMNPTTETPEPSVKEYHGNQQDQYLRYLRRMRKDILKSRSWSVTRPLRQGLRRQLKAGTTYKGLSFAAVRKAANSSTTKTTAKTTSSSLFSGWYANITSMFF